MGMKPHKLLSRFENVMCCLFFIAVGLLCFGPLMVMWIHLLFGGK